MIDPTTQLNFHCFGPFKLNLATKILYKEESEVSISANSIEVLCALVLERPNYILKNKILETVWRGLFVEENSVEQAINELRDVFGDTFSRNQVIRTKWKRGYAFVYPDESPSPADHEKVADFQPETRKRWLPKSYFIGFILLFLIAVGLIYWTWYWRDMGEIELVVKNSQMYESFVLYRYPEKFQESSLDKYWTREEDTNGNSDRLKIRDTIQKLVREGRKYGDGTKNVQFRFESINITWSGNEATARTWEEWQAANFQTNGTLIKTVQIGPYFVDYLLLKVNGSWLIERSTTGRTVRPQPSLTALTPLTTPVSDKEFHVNLEGSDIEPLTIYLEVIGTDCPEVKPCRIDNKILTTYALPTANGIENVPLTLKSGEFKIIARNGDSRPSDPVRLIVP